MTARIARRRRLVCAICVERFVLARGEMDSVVGLAELVEAVSDTGQCPYEGSYSQQAAQEEDTRADHVPEPPRTQSLGIDAGADVERRLSRHAPMMASHGARCVRPRSNPPVTTHVATEQPVISCSDREEGALRPSACPADRGASNPTRVESVLFPAGGGYSFDEEFLPEEECQEHWSE